MGTSLSQVWTCHDHPAGGIVVPSLHHPLDCAGWGVQGLQAMSSPVGHVKLGRPCSGLCGLPLQEAELCSSIWSLRLPIWRKLLTQYQLSWNQIRPEMLVFLIMPSTVSWPVISPLSCQKSPRESRAEACSDWVEPDALSTAALLLLEPSGLLVGSDRLFSKTSSSALQIKLWGHSVLLPLSEASPFCPFHTFCGLPYVADVFGSCPVTSGEAAEFQWWSE